MRISAGRPKPVGIWRPIYQAMDTSKAFHITTKPQANSDCAASLAIGLAATAPGPGDMELGPAVTALGRAAMAPGPDPMAIRPSPNGSPTGRTNLAPGLEAFHG